jgi:hypothetical protein
MVNKIILLILLCALIYTLWSNIQGFDGGLEEHFDDHSSQFTSDRKKRYKVDLSSSIGSLDAGSLDAGSLDAESADSKSLDTNSALSFISR